MLLRQLRPSTSSSSRLRPTLHLCQELSSTPKLSIPQVPLWINDESVRSTSKSSFKKRHPQSKNETCEIVVAGEGETLEAIKHSKRAFKGWKRVSGWERRKILSKVLKLLQERFPSFEEALRADTSFSDILIGADQRSAVNITDGAASTAISIDGWIPPTIDSSLALVLREPYGPILSIPAFNFPLTLALRSIVYPIACGNTVIMKSSPLVPQLHHFLGPLFKEAGLPKGVFQILNFCEDNVAERVEQMIAHPDIRMVNFTGSVSLGRTLAAQCGKHLKPSLMELGGKSAALVLPGADLKLAANNILFGAYFNSGQVCMSTERVIVHQDVAAQFESLLREEFKAFEGKRFNLEREGHSESLKLGVAAAIEEGAELYSLEKDDSSLSTPVILSDVSSSSKIYSEETFGPVLLVQKARDVEHAVEIANEHETGLTCSVWTSDYKLALDVARRIDSGAVHINAMTIHDQHSLPHGGVKSSGWGRFNGRGAIEAFTWTKNVTLQEGHMLPLGAL